MPYEPKLDIHSEELIHNLTLLFMQNQDLKGKNPEEIFAMYESTYCDFKKIAISKANENNSKWF